MPAPIYDITPDLEAIRDSQPGEVKSICTYTRQAKELGVHIYRVDTWDQASFLVAVVDGVNVIKLKDLN